jgi:hypothetical protein
MSYFYSSTFSIGTDFLIETSTIFLDFNRLLSFRTAKLGDIFLLPLIVDRIWIFAFKKIISRFYLIADAAILIYVCLLPLTVIDLTKMRHFFMNCFLSCPPKAIKSFIQLAATNPSLDLCHL